MTTTDDEGWNRALRAWSPSALVLGPLSGGHRGDVREVLVEGERLVGRMARNRSSEALDWEIDLLQHMASMGLGVPETVPTAKAEWRAGALVLARKIAGRPPRTSDWEGVAQYLVRLHSLTRGWPQRPGFASASELLMAQAGGDVDFSSMPSGVVEIIRSSWAALPEVEPCVVHGDPGASNVFVKDSGGIVLIDWDEARVDHPYFDLAAIPRQLVDLDDRQWSIAQRASASWEVAVSWIAEPEYARRRLAELL